MTTAYYSTVLDHPLETVWSLIRDFNSYPDYIDGVSESIIEDDRGGDEVGAIRRFCYLGNWIRQRLAAHSDDAHSLTYAGLEPLPFPDTDTPEVVSPTSYQGTIIWCRSPKATAHLSSGRSRSIPLPRMRSAGTRCSSHGYRTGRIRW